jgi:hypothetical protein
MNSNCRFCGGATDIVDHTIHALQPIKIKHSPYSGGYIRYRHIGTHDVFVCKKCGDRIFRRRWLPVIVGCSLVCIILPILPLANAKAASPNGANPLLVCLVFALLLVLGFLALRFKVDGAELFSRNESINRNLQKALRGVLQSHYNKSVEVDSGVFQNMNAIRLVSPTKMTSMKKKIVPD